jgi:hypothetical protein
MLLELNVDPQQEKLQKRSKRRKHHWLRNPKTWRLIVQVGRTLFWILKMLKAIAELLGWM